MLRVVYEASPDLQPGEVAEINESRGLIRVRIAPGTTIQQCAEALNVASKSFLAECRWFQIWRGHILSADSPEGPLTATYVIDDNLDRRKVIEMRESRGLVQIHIASSATLDDFIRAMNPAAADFLAGGQWFQLWEGEIITMDSPPEARAA
jgi:hypothetical protein